MAIQNTLRGWPRKKGRRLAWTLLIPLAALTLTWALAPVAPGQKVADEDPRAQPVDSETAAEGASPGLGLRRSRSLGAAEDVTSPGDLVLMLLGVIVLITISAFWLRRFLRGARLAPGKEKSLELVDALPLGPRRHVWVVGYKDRVLVLGGGQEEISLLAEYSQDELPGSRPASKASASREATVPPETQRPAAPAHDEAPTPRPRVAAATARGGMDAPRKGGLPSAFQRLLEGEEGRA